MAGIGFELRKVFGKKTLASSIGGIIYASMTTIGPSIVFVGLMIGLRVVLNFFNIREMESLFFMSSFTYMFAVAIVVASLLNTVLSRYISDKIYENKEKDICGSLYGAITVGAVISGVTGLIIVGLLWKVEGASWILLLPYYSMYVLSTNTNILTTYVSALKKYKEVTFIYLIGIALVIPVFIILHKNVGLHILVSVYWGLTGGFFVINALLIGECLKAFGPPGENYFEFLVWYKKYPLLFISGISYMVGFYISNVIYWFCSDMTAQVSIFKTAPNYDLAIFLAILINLSSMVIFEVKTETVFYEKYIYFLSILEKGTYNMIEKARESIQNTLNLQLFFIYEVQLVITITLICLANVFHPYLGIGNEVLRLFLLTGMGIYCTLCMYFTIIFLYYFEDHKAACIGPCVFLVIVTLGSLFCGIVLKDYYTLPLLIGAIAGWLISFLLLKKRIQNLTKYLLCR